MDPGELRDATRSEHEATEALMPLIQDGLTWEIYVATLQKLRPIVQSWERWALATGPDSLQPMLAARRRSQWLTADLRLLGASDADRLDGAVDWEAVVEADGLRKAEFEAAFLGAMYVMEGSTLGGRFLARHVEAVLGLLPGQGDAYLQGHGEATGAMWREVTAKITAVPEALSPQVIGAARRVFRAFGNALRTGLTAQETVQS